MLRSTPEEYAKEVFNDAGEQVAETVAKVLKVEPRAEEGAPVKAQETASPQIDPMLVLSVLAFLAFLGFLAYLATKK